MSEATQARCPECGHNLGDWAGPHVPGCLWAREQARRMQGRGWTEKDAVLRDQRAQDATMTNLFSFEPPKRTPEEQAFADAISEQIAREGMTLYSDDRYDSPDSRYPQEPEEPRPATWFERARRWFR